jgi:hypothetical protein
MNKRTFLSNKHTPISLSSQRQVEHWREHVQPGNDEDVAGANGPNSARAAGHSSPGARAHRSTSPRTGLQALIQAVIEAALRTPHVVSPSHVARAHSAAFVAGDEHGPCEAAVAHGDV